MDVFQQENEQTAAAIKANIKLILGENAALADAIDYGSFNRLVTDIKQASAIFLVASGRSGFSMRSIAMRLMHLGLKVFFVGDTTTPAIKAGDLLWVSSGSGTTGSIVKAAEKAKQAGARVIAMTTNASSVLAAMADVHILIPAAEKQDHNKTKSAQYAGSLFEQAILLLGDAVFMHLWKIDGSPVEELWKRHANME